MGATARSPGIKSKRLLAVSHFRNFRWNRARAHKDQRSQFPYAFTAGLIIVAILVTVIVLVVKHTRTAPVAEVKLPYGAAEQAYSDRIHFDDIKLAHATNFLNQDFTYVAGTVANMGDKDIKAIQVQIEFRNTLDQVVLRETESPHSA